MPQHVDLLIIGAGPFGLALAAYANHHRINHLVLGKPMEFWQSNMPLGMFLRSACDWHLDPLNIHTIEHYLEMQNLTPADVEPLSLAFYLGYAKWFQAQKQIEPTPSYVRQLHSSNNDQQLFEARLDNGQTITANKVVIALGFGAFKHIPENLARILPVGRFSHTCDLVDFTSLKHKRCLVIGGRQSAFEWTALLHEAGAAAIHVSHRHDTPAFIEADWSWVSPLVERLVEEPGWFRNLSQPDKEEINRRLWAEGRLKVEPWLWPRINKDNVRLWPNSHLTACRLLPGGELEVRLDIGETLNVDHIILATGYKVDICRLPILEQGNILSRLAVNNGFPVLDEQFQTNIPGLFITSMPAAQDFGPFFGFTISVRTSATIIGEAVKE